MTQINTYIAEGYWKKETDYLKTIEYVAFNKDSKISLITDEEGNNETILTPNSARYVAEELLKLAEMREKLDKEGREK